MLPDPEETLAPGSPQAAVPAEGPPAPRRPLLPRRLPQAGELLGERYRIERLLGRGAMGAVFAARDGTGREVAIKVQLGVPRADAHQRFRREAEAVARLRHPGVVAIHDFGVDGRGLPYIAMDMVPGGSLGERVDRDGPLDPREAAELTLQLARALAYAHGEGVLHRDLKPHNVLVTPEGRAVLTDFGLAKLVDQSQHLSRTGQLLGTPAYMAPEQARGQVQAIGPAADVYGLGATLYDLVTGDPPFSGLAPFQLLVAATTTPPRPPSELRDELPPAIDRICLRCLAKSPAERYPSMDALAADLAAFLAGEGLASGPPRAARLAGVALSVALLGTLAAVAWVGSAPEDPGPPAPTPDAAPAPTPPRRLEWERESTLRLDAEGSSRARLFVPDAAFAAHLVLNAPPGVEAILRGPTRVHQVTSEAGWRIPLVLRRDACHALESGPHELELRGPPGQELSLWPRTFADAAQTPTVGAADRRVLPALEACFSPAGRAEAERVLGELRSLLEAHPSKQERREIRPRLRALYQRLDALAQDEGTPLASLWVPLQGESFPGRIKRAHAAARELLPAYPREPAIRWQLGRAAVDEGDWTQAEEHLRVLCELEPNRIGARVERLRCLMNAERWDPARTACAQLLAIVPQLPHAVHLAGLLDLARSPPAWKRGVDRCVWALARGHRGAAQRRIQSLMSLERAFGEELPARAPGELPAIAARFLKQLEAAEVLARHPRLGEASNAAVHFELLRARCLELTQGAEAARTHLEAFAPYLEAPGIAQQLKQRLGLALDDLR